MSQEKATLEVGDRVIGETRFVGLRSYKIDRVTKTRAFAGNQGFVRKFQEQKWLDPYPAEHGYNITRYSVATDKLVAQFERQKMRYKIDKIKWEDVPTDKLKQVLAILGE